MRTRYTVCRLQNAYFKYECVDMYRTVRLYTSIHRVYDSVEYRWFRKPKTESQNRVSPQCELPSAPPAAAPADALSVPMRAAKRAPMTSPPPPPPTPQVPEAAAAAAQKAPAPSGAHPEAANEQVKKRPANCIISSTNPFFGEEDGSEDAAVAPAARSELSASTDALAGDSGGASGTPKPRALSHLLPADEKVSSSQQAKRAGSLREARSGSGTGAGTGSGTATPPDSLDRDGGPQSQEKPNPFSPPARPPPPRNSAGPGASNSLNVSSPELRRPDAQAYAANQENATAQPVERSSSGPSARVEPQ